MNKPLSYKIPNINNITLELLFLYFSRVQIKVFGSR